MIFSNPTLVHLVIFLVGSTGLVYLSRHALADPHQHGFPRFFAFEAILGLVVLNVGEWLVNPLSFVQLISWVLLIISAVLVISAVMALRQFGKADTTMDDPNRLAFEKTTQLVNQGPYRYIRHPMYASLLFLAWGVFLKDITILTFCLVGITTAMLYLTAVLEEVENRAYFGDRYKKYMRQTKRFIPFLF
jgi:protein-S-isoprenylcysteine O-methyltransferase Ste14